jgi:hypothetical protein
MCGATCSTESIRVVRCCPLLLFKGMTIEQPFVPGKAAPQSALPADNCATPAIVDEVFFMNHIVAVRTPNSVKSPLVLSDDLIPIKRRGRSLRQQMEKLHSYLSWLEELVKAEGASHKPIRELEDLAFGGVRVLILEGLPGPVPLEQATSRARESNPPRRRPSH